LREIKARYEKLESDKMQLEILKMKPKPRRIFWPSKINIEKRKLAEISHKKQLDSIRDTIKERERELDCFLKQAVSLKKQIGNVNRERRQKLELQSWTAKGRRMASDL
jgi:hypothetical protein